jgi:hypothetical protein
MAAAIRNFIPTAVKEAKDPEGRRSRAIVFVFVFVFVFVSVTAASSETCRSLTGSAAVNTNGRGRM